jgi:integrase
VAQRRKAAKPSKPCPDFPLYPHASGRWAKKVKGKLHYFGKVADDPKGQAALERWLDQKDDLLAGRVPRAKGDGFTVKDLTVKFLERKQHHRDTGEIVQRTYDDYFRACTRVAHVFGKNRLVEDLRADDFQKLRQDIAETNGPVSLGNEIQRVRTLFKFAWDEGLISSPIRYGQSFDKPNRKLLREARNRRHARMFEADECRELLDAAGVHLRAMIYLGLNCGFGNTDCEQLPRDAVNLETGWIDFPRPKTAVARRCPLWPETVEALRASLTKRPTPKNEAHAGLFFVTKYGGSWHREKERGPICLQFRRLLNDLELHKPGRGFYSLRHVFETIGGDSRDQVAVDFIMGHVREDMASIYRERVSDDRLRAVVDHVHGWLFAPAENAAATNEEPEADEPNEVDEEPAILRFPAAG